MFDALTCPFRAGWRSGISFSSAAEVNSPSQNRPQTVAISLSSQGAKGSRKLNLRCCAWEDDEKIWKASSHNCIQLYHCIILYHGLGCWNIFKAWQQVSKCRHVHQFNLRLQKIPSWEHNFWHAPDVFYWEILGSDLLYTRNGSKNIQKSSATETSNAKQHGASCDGPAKSRRSHLISSRDQLVVPEENSHGSFRCLSEGGEKLSKTLKYNLVCKRYRQIQCTWITDSCSLWILKYQSWTFLNCPFGAGTISLSQSHLVISSPYMYDMS